MKTGGIEIKYLWTGFEEFNKHKKWRIGFALRHWYVIITFRVMLNEDSFYRNFVGGYSRQRKKIIFGINK